METAETINEYPAPKNPITANNVEVNIANLFPQLWLPQHPQQSLFFRPRNTKAGKIIKTPLPSIPPKYQTSSERWLLSSITFPPGKNNRIFARRPNTARGMRVPPRHLAQPPVHMLGWHNKARVQTAHQPLHGAAQGFWQRVPVAVPSSVRIVEPRMRAFPTVSLESLHFSLEQALNGDGHLYP